MEPTLFEVFAQAFTTEWNRLQSTVTGERARWEAERKRLAQQIDRVVDAIADGTAGGSLTDRLALLERTDAELERRLADAPPSVPRLHPSLAHVYRRKMAELSLALASDGGQPVIDSNPFAGRDSFALCRTAARCALRCMANWRRSSRSARGPTAPFRGIVP